MNYRVRVASGEGAGIHVYDCCICGKPVLLNGESLAKYERAPSVCWIPACCKCIEQNRQVAEPIADYQTMFVDWDRRMCELQAELRA